MQTGNWMQIWREVRDGQLPLVDLRSEKEFFQGAIPRALNLPLLDNDERHIVGKTYKEIGRIEATQLGIELFAKKSQDFMHKVGALTERSNGRLAIYCWRGGMRSGMVGQWLRAAGYRVCTLSGGYKEFRRTVININDEAAERPWTVLMGRTGAGKTDLLRSLSSSVAAIDFEGIACHRGSAFGDFGQQKPSPTQQNFENLLAEEFLSIPLQRPILAEIENFIGPCALPTKLRRAIASAPMVLVERDFEDRVNRLAKEYAPHWDSKMCQLFLERLKLLEPHMSRLEASAIENAACRGDLSEVVRSLLRLRYDKTYDKAIVRRAGRYVAEFNLTQNEDGARAWLKGRLNI